MDQERQLRIEVAEACRMLEHVGLIDFSGHISARVPGTDQLYINNWGTMRNKVTPEHIVKTDLACNVLTDNGPAPSETHIHASIYRARPDVLAVSHLHPPVTTALSIAGKKFLPVIYHGSIFHQGIGVYDDSRHVDSVERGDALAQVLGEGRVAIIRGHGCAVAAHSVKSCFFASIYLEDNAEKLALAYQLGTPQAIGPEEMAEGSTGIWKDGQFNKVWNYYKDKSGIDFSDWQG